MSKVRLNKKVKTQTVEIIKFWNDTHTVTMIFEPLKVEEPEIPTGIQVKISDIPEIPTNIKLSI